MSDDSTAIDDIGEQEERKSKYHGAFAILYRLDALWKDTHRHARDAMYIKWNEDLDRVWLELVADTKPEKREEIDKINDEISKTFLYSTTENLRFLSPKLFGKLITIQKKLLMKKETLLREIQNDQGKGTAYQDSMEDYFGEDV